VDKLRADFIFIVALCFSTLICGKTTVLDRPKHGSTGRSIHFVRNLPVAANSLTAKRLAGSDHRPRDDAAPGRNSKKAATAADN
jgi:hypothetical protein